MIVSNEISQARHYFFIKLTRGAAPKLLVVRGAGGEPGDLILTFKVKPHSFFRRRGSDIHVTVPINVAQAILGSKVRVRTVDGPPVVLKIPPGTQSGTRFRIRGHGVQKGAKQGDQYGEVKVETPESVPEEWRDFFSQGVFSI
jgi:DnaJ-class molecular chaperone